MTKRKKKGWVSYRDEKSGIICYTGAAGLLRVRKGDENQAEWAMRLIESERCVGREQLLQPKKLEDEVKKGFDAPNF